MKQVIKYVDDMLEQVNKSIIEIEKIQTFERAEKANAPTFKPNEKLGEGKASARNLEYRQSLLTLLKDSVYTPVQTMLKKKMEVDARIKIIDDSVDNYITQGKKLIETKKYKMERKKQTGEQ